MDAGMDAMAAHHHAPTYHYFGLLYVAFGIFMSFASYKFPGFAPFTVGTIFAGTFAWAQVAPYYETGESYFFYHLAVVVALTGGAIGGAYTILMPTLCSLVEIGLTTSIILGLCSGADLVDSIPEWGTTAVLATIVAVALICGNYLKNPKLLCALTTSFTGAFLVIYGLDHVLNGHLWATIVHLARGSSLSPALPKDVTPFGDHPATPTADEPVHESDATLVPMLLLWAVTSACGALFQLYSLGLSVFASDCCGGDSSKRNSYAAIPTTDGGKSKAKASDVGKTRDVHTGAYNFFDPRNLPQDYVRLCPPIFVNAEALGNFFGFQDDNVHGQAEHVLMLLNNARRYNTPEHPESAVVNVKDKIFTNYKDWCRSLHIEPIFSPKPTNPKNPVGGHEADLLLWFCIWGEGANLRHMPECLCFLYHKTATEWADADESVRQSISGKTYYPGHFLDHTITPIYTVLFKAAKLRKDHVEKRHYDDFNEYFWTPECLDCSYTSEIRGNHGRNTTINIDNDGGFGDFNTTPFIADVLNESPKTYLEKRSWFHVFLSFRRVYEWHIITMQLMACVAFGKFLVWDMAYIVQMLSSVFLSLNFLRIVWTLLSTWVSFPGVKVTSPALCGIVLSLAWYYLIFFYQTLYFTWAMDHMKIISDVGMRANGSDQFWWWQYVWLSLLCSVGYGLEVILQVVPTLATVFYEFSPKCFGIQSCMPDVWSDIWTALVNICFPLTRLYVGKRVHEAFYKVIQYQFFWLTLICWKLYFGWRFIVSPLVEPTVALYDDYMNFPEVTYWTTAILMVLRWIPAFLIFNIDMSIWYSLWSGLMGIYVGMDVRLGVVKNFNEIRDHFMDCPKAFCEKLISRKALPGLMSDQAGSIIDENRSRRTGSLAMALPNFRSTTDLLPGGLSAQDMGPGYGAMDHMEGGAQMLSGSHSNEFLRNYVNAFLDSNSIKGRQWVIFAAAWNEVIDQLRLGDLIADEEKDMLKFNSFNSFRKPVYLPVFQTAGSTELASTFVVEQAIAHRQAPNMDKKKEIYDKMCESIKSELCMFEAVGETWELTGWLIRQVLGPAHEEDISTVIDIISGWIEDEIIFDCMRMEQVTAISASVIAIVKTLKSGMNKRAKKPVRTSRTSRSRSPKPAMGSSLGSKDRLSTDSMKKSVSTSGLASLAMQTAGVEVEGTGKAKFSLPSTKYDKTEGRDVRREQEKAFGDPMRDQVQEKLRALFGTLKGMVVSNGLDANMSAQAKELLDALTLIGTASNGFMWDSSYATEQVNAVSQDLLTLKVVRKLHGLLAVRQNEAEPVSQEAKRRLAFFVNSLFMEMPNAPKVEDMRSFTVVTPFYSEDVIYTKGDLERENTDGVTVLLYLQTLFKQDWENFIERLKITEPGQIWSPKFLMETRMWASLRAQTLARTVQGMMYYEAALRLLSRLEKVDPSVAEDLIKEKYSYVVAAQVYGKMKKNQDNKAEDIDYLLKKYPNLRVAYIDESRGRDGRSQFYSVLIKATQDGEPGEDGSGIQKIYSVRLPGNPVLGEGKPENQNHAMIFTRGEYVQAIDMNQDGFFEEALKHRNLLEEFKSKENALPITILGFREHIFTGSVSSLANYMALQEASFVTTGQRVLTRPLCIRLHYGHPDLFDKLFFMQRGGVSKASKGINLSEDVFAGYSNVIRGGQVAFKEYCQVGKGRDVGMQQIYKFEAKLSQGAAEQSLSRDVARLTARLDFGRLMSYFFGGIGHYINSCATVFAIITVTYANTFMAMYGYEAVGDRMIVVLGTLQIVLAGMGVIQTLPLLATLIVEQGMFLAMAELIKMFGTGGPFYFIFHIQTRAYYLYQTLIAGGAQYRATGRGFVTRHSRFDENWRFFAGSHIYLGIELACAMVLYGCFSEAHQFWGHTWSMWLACGSFMWTPFWFNPLAFSWTIVLDDYKHWLLWIGSKGGSASHSWDTWWREEKSFIWRLRTPEKLCVVSRAGIYLAMAYGACGEENFTQPRLKEFAWMAAISGSLLVGTMTLDSVSCRRGLCSSSIASGSHSLTWQRVLRIPFVVGFIVSIFYFFHKYDFFLRMGVAFYYCLCALYTVMVVSGLTSAKHLLRVHDMLFGHLMFLPLFVMAALQIPDKIQTWLLYHNALNEGVLIDTILKQARKSHQIAEQQSNQNPTNNQQAATSSPPGASATATAIELLEMRAMIEAQQATIRQLQASQNAMQTGYSSNSNSRTSPVSLEEVVAAGSGNEANRTPTDLGSVFPTATSSTSIGGEAAADNADGNGAVDHGPGNGGGSGGAGGDGFSFTQPDQFPKR